MTEIKKGNCYMCLEDIKGYDSFTKGSDYFRIATEQEIKAQKMRIV